MSTLSHAGFSHLLTFLESVGFCNTIVETASRMVHGGAHLSIK